MTTMKHTDSATGPWTNLSHIYCGHLDAAQKAADPVLRAATQLQLEWARLTMQRGRAWASLPAELSRCKSPVDVAVTQAKFWQTAALNYTEGLHRLWHASAAMALRHEVADAMPGAPQRDVLDIRTDEEPAATGPRKRQAA